jgi:hypothetical protein
VRMLCLGSTIRTLERFFMVFLCSGHDAGAMLMLRVSRPGILSLDATRTAQLGRIKVQLYAVLRGQSMAIGYGLSGDFLRETLAKTLEVCETSRVWGCEHAKTLEVCETSRVGLGVNYRAVTATGSRRSTLPSSLMISSTYV